MNLVNNLKRRFRLNHLLVFLLSILFYNCSNEEIPDQGEKIIPVSIVEIKSSEVSIPVITSGKITAQEEIKLSFKTGGVLEEILVDEGEFVRKGQLLAQINLQEINAHVMQAESGFEKARRDFSRVHSLYEDSVVTLEQYQNVKTALEVAESNLEIAEFNKNFSSIIAPSNGRIYKKFAEANEIVAPGIPIFLFGSSNNSWKIKVGLTDKDIKKIKIGDSAKVAIDAIPQKDFSSNVTEIAGSADMYSSTYLVELSINKAAPGIISGMIASVKIFPESEGVFKSIPIKSLVNADKLKGEVYTFNRNSGTARKISVKIKDIWNEDVIIESGLEKIENVIFDGVEYMYDGANVRVESVSKTLSGENE